MKEKVKEIIIKKIDELDNRQQTYQFLHRQYFGEEDLEAKNIHEQLVGLCNYLLQKVAKI